MDPDRILCAIRRGKESKPTSFQRLGDRALVVLWDDALDVRLNPDLQKMGGIAGRVIEFAECHQPECP